MRSITGLILCTAAVAGMAEEAPRGPMTQQRLHEIVAATGSDVRAEGNVVAFRLGEVTLLCISDPNADRMRIIAPVKRRAVMHREAEQRRAAAEKRGHARGEVLLDAPQGALPVRLRHRC
jgi:hypothetical protein